MIVVEKGVENEEKAGLGVELSSSFHQSCCWPGSSPQILSQGELQMLTALLINSSPECCH